jgi:hypothetical protein
MEAIIQGKLSPLHTSYCFKIDTPFVKTFLALQIIDKFADQTA